jgi:hypothetical protein
MFEAIVFSIVDCGFVPRSARERTDSGDIRLIKIRDIIRASAASARRTVAGPTHIKDRFKTFSSILPSLTDRIGLNRRDLQFVEYVSLVENWLKR